MLSIVRYIKENGLEAAIERFGLKARRYSQKIHLKYNQFVSDYADEEVCDCRGLILELNTWRIMCMSFRKFFNHLEPHAHEIDWNSAVIFQKLDGSLMQTYFDDHQNKWFAATTGTAEGEGEVNNKFGTTFNNLFWEVAMKYNPDILNQLNKQYTYSLELTSPFNIVVKPHVESSITLLAMRHNGSLMEVAYSMLKVESVYLGLPLVKVYDFNVSGLDELSGTLNGLPFSEEGYVIVDKYFNRVKIKNPAYVEAHHKVTGGGYSNIISIIKNNEVDEYLTYFVERRAELIHLKKSFDGLNEKLKTYWAFLKIYHNFVGGNGRLYAEAVFKLTKFYSMERFGGLFFGLASGTYTDIREYLCEEVRNKELYKMLIEGFKK